MNHSRKTCRECQMTFIASVRHFFRAKDNTDGLMNICKSCKTKNNREREELKADHVRQVKAAYARTPHAIAWQAAYRQTEHGKRLLRASRLRYVRWKKLTMVSAGGPAQTCPGSIPGGTPTCA